MLAAEGLDGKNQPTPKVLARELPRCRHREPAIVPAVETYDKARREELPFLIGRVMRHHGECKFGRKVKGW